MNTAASLATTKPLAPAGGAAVASSDSDPDRIASLEKRVAQLEADQKRFMDAMLYAGKFIFNNPASKMILMTLPKEMKEGLEKFFNSQNGTQI